MANSKKFCSTIKHKISEEISELPPHSKLESRMNLAQRYEVNKATIDRIISQLIGEGKLYSKPKSGTYVSEKQHTSKIYPALSSERKNHSWALIIPNIMKDVYPGILRGVEDIAQKHGRQLIICNTDDFSDKQKDYIDSLLETGIGGMIVVPAIKGDNDIESFQNVIKANIPLVFCNRHIFNLPIPCVKPNNFYGAFMATKELINSGYKRIAFVAFNLYSTSSERLQGYYSALQEHYYPIDEDLVLFTSNHPSVSAYKKIQEMLQGDNPPDAFFCFNDNVAVVISRVIENVGLRVGTDIGIFGYDNTPVCEIFSPKLSSVEMKPYDIGKAAAELILEIQKGRNVTYTIRILNPVLCKRESSLRTALELDTSVLNE